MRNSLIIFMGAILFIFTYCNSKNNKATMDSTNSCLIHKSTCEQSYGTDTSAFCPILLNEIKNFIKDYSNDLDRVISIVIRNDGDNCYLLISNDMFYYSHLLYGYQVIEEKMVAYYFNFKDSTMTYNELVSQLQSRCVNDLLSESECSNRIIEKTKLRTDRPSVFPDELSDYAHGWFSEPICRTYIIHSSDSLELVFEGCY